MRNRAKCRLCGDILESLNRHDFFTCKCGEISVDGGRDYVKGSAKDPKNYIPIDDNDNEIDVNFDEPGMLKSEAKVSNEDVKSHQYIDTKEDLIKEVDVRLSYIQGLPEHATREPLSQYDFGILLLLMKRMLTI